MSDTFEQITARLTNEPGSRIAQALAMDRTEMFNAWTHNLSDFAQGGSESEEAREHALPAHVRDAYQKVVTRAGGVWNEWEATMIAMKGLSPSEVQALVRHGFDLAEITIASWAVEDGAARLRKFIVRAEGPPRSQPSLAES